MNENIHAKPTLPAELLIYQHLQKRKNFTNGEQKKFHNAKIGYDGELSLFNFLNRSLPSEKLLLHSLQLSYNHSEFQVDSLLIWQNTIYLFEVKNFSGDFYVQNKNWYVSPSNREINNPLIQLSRAESLLRQLIGSLGFQFDIQSYLIFINPEFALFQAPMNLPIILHAQLNRFFKKLMIQSGVPSKNALSLAQMLQERHLKQSAYEQLPMYTEEELKKGIFCPKCIGEMFSLSNASVICNRCDFKETNEHSIIRSTKEFHLLFPNKPISTKNISEWINLTISTRSIWRVLTKHFKQVKKGNNTYYLL